MARIERFEDIEAWQKARKLTGLIYRLSGESAFGRDFPLRDQIRRATISMMSNIAEGFNRGGNRELIQYLSIAKGSAAEVQSQLYIALDAGHIDQSTFQVAYDMAGQVTNLIGAFICYLNAAPQRGPKYSHQDNTTSH